MTRKTSELIVKGHELFAYIKRLIEEGNVRRLIIKKSSGKKVLEIPLSAGVGLGGLFLVLAPVILAISSVAAWFAKYRIEIIHADDADE